MSDNLVADALSQIGNQPALKQEDSQLRNALHAFIKGELETLAHGEKLLYDDAFIEKLQPIVLKHGSELSADGLTRVVGEVLKQYGVPGMKWGVRKDRSSGSKKTKRSKSDSTDTTDTTTARKSGGSSSSSGPARKTVKSMSDSELRDALNRLQMEKQYAQLTAPQKSQNIVAEVLKSSGSQVARNVLTQLGTAYVGRALNVNLNKALPDAYKVPIKNKGGDQQKKEDDD